jgi:hypothetical protein
MNEIKVNLEKGEVILTPPKGGVFADAFENADDGTGKPNMIKLINKILPHCVVNHPFGNIHPNHWIRDLSMEEYVMLFKGVQQMLQERLSIINDSEKK